MTGGKNMLSQPVFEDCIMTLFLFGQLPVIIFSFLIILSVGFYYKAEMTGCFLVLSIALIFALATSLVAVTLYRRSQNSSVSLLVASLIITLIYLTFLVRLTSGSSKPFQHFYLYLPAVVLMVSLWRRWAEIVTIAGVFGSYLLNYGNLKIWPAWQSFENAGICFKLFECGFVLGMLICLSLVNYRMEKLMRRYFPTLSEGKTQ